jgi:hypothetical protein
MKITQPTEEAGAGAWLSLAKIEVNIYKCILLHFDLCSTKIFVNSIKVNP